MNKQASLLGKQERRDRGALLSQESFPTQLDEDDEDRSLVGQREGYRSDSGFESLDPIYEDHDSFDSDEVLLNISPNKFEKPKDQLYMDFFVKYTELFVSEKNKGDTKLP